MTAKHAFLLFFAIGETAALASLAVSIAALCRGWSHQGRPGRAYHACMGVAVCSFGLMVVCGIVHAVQLAASRP